MIPLFEHNVCNEIAMQGIGTHENSFLAAMWLEMLILLHYTERGRSTEESFCWPLCGWNCTLLYIVLNEKGANKVADVPTGVVQDAILDHMGLDFRCQNEVMTTKNC